MNIIDGLATCFLCGEQFDLGHHYDFHMIQCLNKKRVYTKLDPKIKQSIVLAVEETIRYYLPGALLGYGEI